VGENSFTKHGLIARDGQSELDKAVDHLKDVWNRIRQAGSYRVEKEKIPILVRDDNQNYNPVDLADQLIIDKSHTSLFGQEINIAYQDLRDAEAHVAKATYNEKKSDLAGLVDTSIQRAKMILEVYQIAYNFSLEPRYENRAS
jgi:hypothetical protein